MLRQRWVLTRENTVHVNHRVVKNGTYSGDYSIVVHPMYVPTFRESILSLSLPQISLGDFSIHRIIGRGGFGEVYGCRKDDSGRMYVHVLVSILHVPAFV